MTPNPRYQPSQTWRTFLDHHARGLVSLDFFTVATAACACASCSSSSLTSRRVVVHFNVTEHATAPWTAQQIVDAFPDDSAPFYLLPDRDRRTTPWPDTFAERLIGSVRRECLDHVVVLSERHPRCPVAQSPQQSRGLGQWTVEWISLLLSESGEVLVKDSL